MKVYVVLSYHYEEVNIIAIFSTPEKAEAFVKDPDNIKAYFDLGWDEFDVDELPPLKKRMI